MRNLVLDSWAIIKYFEDADVVADKIEKILVNANSSGDALSMSVVNIGEIWYSFARTRSRKSADQAICDIRDLGICFVPVNWELAHSAATFKSKHRIAYADCFVAALARKLGVPVVTGDPEFKQLKQDIEICWVA